MRCLLLALLVLLCAAARPAPAQDRPALAVVGLASEVRDDAWDDARVGLGLRNVLAELFYEAGAFTLLEDRPEVMRRLDAMAERAWALDDADSAFRDAADSLRAFAPDFVAYGRVLYFGRPRSRASLGPLHANTQTVEIRVEVTLEEAAAGTRYTKKGVGKTRTRARSAIFTYREDAVELDKTAVGTATREALQEAVARVMKAYAKDRR
ncbi:MAG: hypothetical protein R3247_04770 [Rhodothermales bacterium]|nr:hypothetical protein [Rhodothermales bacterium]